jgi:hypothetical protein
MQAQFQSYQKRRASSSGREESQVNLSNEKFSILNSSKLEMVPREMKMGEEELQKMDARRREWLRKASTNRMINARQVMSQMEIRYQMR